MKKVTLTLSRLAAIAATSTFCLLATSCGDKEGEKSKKELETAKARITELEGKTVSDCVLRAGDSATGDLVISLNKGATTVDTKVGGAAADATNLKNGFGKTLKDFFPAAAAKA